MKIENNNNLCFKKVILLGNAKSNMKRRMPEKAYRALKEDFQRTFEKSDVQVMIGSPYNGGNKLDALIKYENNGYDYLEEGVLSSMFFSPKKFFRRIQSTVEKKVASFNK